MSMPNLEERMQMWRDGLLHGSEILCYLLEAQAEIVKAMRDAETFAVEKRLELIQRGK